MKMTFVNITAEKNQLEENYSIKRLYNDVTSYCNIKLVKALPGVFFGSGFQTVDGATVEHDCYSSETIDDFIKAVFSV